MINTYHGSINETHCLFNHENIICQYYKEVYSNRRIQESSFDAGNIPTDKDSLGKFVNQDFGISKENCPRANILSVNVQHKEHLALIESMKEEEKETKLKLHLAVEKKYELNYICKER